MGREEALNYLIAYACCGLKDMSCTRCPLYAGDFPCEAWDEADIFEALEEFIEM